MKILVAYYSKSGAVEKAAKKIKDELVVQGHEVDLENISPKKERSSFAWRFSPKTEIQPLKIKNLSGYDRIILGAPNWTMIPPPMKRYLSLVEGLKDKSVSLYSTTTLWPAIERYFFSAYLLLMSFNKEINRKGGRLDEFVLLLRGRIDSIKSDRVIREFCHSLVSKDRRLRANIIKKREEDDVHFLAVFFSSLTILSILFQSITDLFDHSFISWDKFWVLLGILATTTVVMILAIEKKRDSSFIKFLTSISLVFSWTLLMCSSTGSIQGITAGYISIFIIMGLFRNIVAVLTAGIIGLLGYSYAYIFYPTIEGLNPTVDIASLAAVLAVVTFVTYNIQRYFIDLTDAQEEAEMAKAVLEIKVRARTRELEEFSKNLENIIEERTEDLKKKVEDLERFSRLTVGRELRMIELKKKLREAEKRGGN